MKQTNLTPSTSKRLIARGISQDPAVRKVLQSGTLVIIAGTTNGYVAEEVLRTLGHDFTRTGFRRGMTTLPGADVPRIDFPGDVVIIDGEYHPGLLITGVVDQLKPGDMVMKGANCLDSRGKAAVQIGHPRGGSVLAAMPAIIGSRVQLVVPVGLEKRVFGEIDDIVARVLSPDADGPRLMPLPGRTFTEIDAIRTLTGAAAFQIAAGGVYGAEGSVWLGIDGTEAQVDAALALLESLQSEPPCRV